MGFFDDLKKIFGSEKAIVQPVSPSASNPQSTPHINENKTKKKILIVEDDGYLLEMYADKFTNAGYEVLKAKNGQEGLDILVNSKPHAVILDLIMPVMDGKTMLQKLREITEFQSLPVVILTNAGQIDNIRETQRYFDAIAFFIKSNVNLNDLVGTIRGAIG